MSAFSSGALMEVLVSLKTTLAWPFSERDLWVRRNINNDYPLSLVMLWMLEIKSLVGNPRVFFCILSCDLLSLALTVSAAFPPSKRPSQNEMKGQTRPNYTSGLARMDAYKNGAKAAALRTIESGAHECSRSRIDKQTLMIVRALFNHRAGQEIALTLWSKAKWFGREHHTRVFTSKLTESETKT